MTAVLSWLGLFILIYRLWPRRFVPSASFSPQDFAFVSIIVPARNEEKNISRLLRSLSSLRYPRYEVIVVDDQSTDQTLRMAESFPVKVISGKPLPEGWNGKNWACHQGVEEAKGDFFLFTDADTEHDPDGLQKAVQYLFESGSDMISALPYHRTENLWEKLLGPFHLILLASTAPHHPKLRRLFAIGQFLLFRRQSYAEIGGHGSIRNQYPDDLALANRCLSLGKTYRVLESKERIYQVRMYPTFKEFVRGWRRNFQAGLQQSTPQPLIEVILMMCALAGFHAPLFLALVYLIWRERSLGGFSPLGVILFPLSVLVFCWVTLLSSLSMIRGNALAWKERNYSAWTR